MRTLILTIIVLVFVAGGSVAQNSSTQLPLCSESEAVELGDIAEDFLVELGDRLDSLGTYDPATWIPELESLQSRWWNEVSPSLPACGLSVQAQLGIGRVVDEFLIAVLLGASEYNDEAQAHAMAGRIILDTLLAESTVPTIGETEAVQSQTYYTTQNANARACPRTTCARVITLQAGTAVSVTNTEEGEAVSGSTTWMHVLYEGREMYIHSSLLSTTRPQTQPTSPPAQGQQQPPAAPTQVQQQPPTEQPTQVQQPAPTQPPPPPVSTPAPAFSCNCSKTCSAMASCEEAYFQLNQCGCGQRDGDGDGVPCEDICPGG